MKRPLKIFALSLVLGLIAAPVHADPGEWSGRVGGQYLGFWKDPLQNEQHNNYLSVVAEPEYYKEWNNGIDSFRFQPFGRLAQHDSNWTHADLRELSYTHVADFWETTVGVSKVFWGVTEVRHLVDIVNQTDLVENQDGEDKLGQPMIKLSLVPEAGTLDLFVLPYFRDRTFPGEQGRPRLPLVVREGDPIFDNSRKRKHTDFAARWFQFLGDWEVGLSHFYGTSREPVFVQTLKGPGNVELRPRYDVINQTGLEAQYVVGGWILKFEGIRRRGQEGGGFFAIDTGFEYTFDPLESGLEIGALMEYLYDSRGDNLPTSFNEVLDATQFNNDIFIGTRWTFNDVQSTQILGGVVAGLKGGGNTFNLEASRRIGESWLLSLEARGVFKTDNGTLLHTQRKDPSIRVEFDYYF